MCIILTVDLMLLCPLKEFKAPLIHYLINLCSSISLSPGYKTMLS